jgi:micrococcal nuclease
MWERFLEVGVGVLMVVLAWLGGGSATAEPSQQTTPESLRSEHVVTHVIDGDTVIIDTDERVRLLGIDTPERGECYFEEATTFATEQLMGRTVMLERDETDRDTYERLLRYVFITTEVGEETLFNTTLVAEGYAELLSIPPDRRYRTELQAAQARARESQLGRWGVCTHELP